MTIVIDKLNNGDYQYIVLSEGRIVVETGFSTWEAAMRFIITGRK